MQKNLVETILGAVVLIVALGFLFFFYRTTDIAPQTGYTLKAAFSKIDGLEAGSPVRISGVKVGRVMGFTLDEATYRAIVRMNIDDNVKLPRDTVAVVASAGLLDGKFMSLLPGSDEEFLKPGEEIEFTQSTPGLEQLLGQVIFSINKNKNETAAEPSAPPAAATATPAPTTETPADAAISPE